MENLQEPLAHLVQLVQLEYLKLKLKLKLKDPQLTLVERKDFNLNLKSE
jgi:hypothetical protein